MKFLEMKYRVPPCAKKLFFPFSFIFALDSNHTLTRVLEMVLHNKIYKIPFFTGQKLTKKTKKDEMNFRQKTTFFKIAIKIL